MGKAKQRDRGRILTNMGWNKIWSAVRYELPDRQTLAAIARHTEPVNERSVGYLTAETIGKIVKHRTPVDEDSIQKLFVAFGLTLVPDDHLSAHQAREWPNDPNFVGRKEAIAYLHELVHRNAKVIVIQARGGIGKTTLARKFLTQEFDTVLEFPIAKETKDIASIESLLEEKLRQLGEEPGREFLVSCDRLKRKLQSDRIGILIDNLEPALDSAGRLIEPHRRYVEVLRILADPSVQSTTLITSRERLRESSITVQTYLLKSLDVAAWKEFFTSRSLATDTPALSALHNAYGGNAKAMEIISGAIAQDFAGDVDQYWQENQDDLFIERDLEDLVKQQFERLQQQHSNAYHLLCRMSCYRYQDVPTVPIEGLFCLMWDVPEKEHKRVVKVLRDRSLIEYINGAYSLHPSIRSKALDHFINSDSWTLANEKCIVFLTESVILIESQKDALVAFEPYYHCIAVENFEWASKILTTRRSDALGNEITLGDTFYRLGLFHQIILAIEKILPHLKCKYKTGILNSTIADSNWMIGNINLAIEYQTKTFDYLHLVLASSIKNSQRKRSVKRHLMYSNLSLGIYNIDLWELKKANDYFEFIISSSSEKYRVKTKAEACLAYTKSCLGFQREANTLVRLVTPKIMDNPLGEGFGSFIYFTLFLASAYNKLGQSEKALEFYEIILMRIGSFPYMHLKAKALCGLAVVYRENGSDVTALKYCLDAVELLKSIGVMCDLAEAYYQLGLSYRKYGQASQAHKNFQSAIQLFTKMDAPKQIKRVKEAISLISYA